MRSLGLIEHPQTLGFEDRSLHFELWYGHDGHEYQFHVKLGDFNGLCCGQYFSRSLSLHDIFKQLSAIIQTVGPVLLNGSASSKFCNKSMCPVVELLLDYIYILYCYGFLWVRISMGYYGRVSPTMVLWVTIKYLWVSMGYDPSQLLLTIWHRQVLADSTSWRP